MNRLALAALLLGAIPLAAQDEEILQLKGGDIVKGKVLKVDEKGIQLQLASNQEIFFSYEQITPFSAYDVRRKRMNKVSAEDHISMGQFCMRYGLLSYAGTHLREAAQRAPERKEEIEKLLSEIRVEDAKSKFRTAKDIVEQKNEKRYEDAARLLHEIIEKYDDTPYYEEARKLEERLAEDIRRMRKDREAQVEAQKKEMEIKGKEKENRELVDRSALSVDEAVKLWGEGLDLEASNSSARAVGSWTTAEAKLLFAKANIDAGLKKSKDAGVISRLTELNKSADQWLVRVYIALGRVAAVDSLDYVQALRWINKAIKIDPDNDKAFALKLSITESAMRARIESSRPPR